MKIYLQKVSTTAQTVFVLLCFVLVVSTAHSQNVPQSKGEPESITTEIKRLELLRLSDPKAFSTGLGELANSMDSMSSYQLCHYNFLLAYQTAFSGESEAAVDQMESVIDGCDDLRAKVRLDALIANISAISGDYAKASSHIDNAIQNANQTTDLDTKGIAYSGASMVYNLLDQHELSVKYSELLNAIDPNSENACKLEFSRNLMRINADQQLPQFEQVEINAQKCKEGGHSVLSHSLVLDYLKEKLKAKIFTADEVLELTQIVNRLKPEIEASAYKNLQVTFAAIEAKVSFLNKNNDAAKAHGLRTLQFNQGLGITEQMILALDVLEKVSLQNNNYETAYNYLNKRNEAELRLYDESQSKQMAFMTVKHSNLAKVFEIDQLNQQKAVLELEKKLSKQETNNQRLIILLILTLLALVLLWLFKIKKRHDYFKDVSEIDHLTKVLTRKAFEEQINELLDNSKQLNNTVQMAIMDLDFFKKVNDTHGHLIGDWVLKNVIYLLKQMMEANMMIARLGGEEFCIVMQAVTDKEMHAKIEKMRQAIAQFDCSESGALLSVTASFGITSSTVSGYNLPMLLTHADLALFEAKNSGRNRVVKFVPTNGQG